MAIAPFFPLRIIQIAIALLSSKNRSKGDRTILSSKNYSNSDRIQLQKTTPKILLTFQVFLEEILSAIACNIPASWSGVAKLI
ncbi:hypothetical protein NIES4075_67820 [Tolypothrix sp. NIES-4075]|uniref:hypothetical protein n=1 Tax=Tolypothrix sp. NIES-4075 TaxID=2005459 RepID=UPI000B6733AF|nr:hypothetical protein [Tolypothrix sp. NIES-4075]GAX45761.1 hypothetical protein NIES4075_67820 [Tolypothrix sp. NIES-4075]